MRKLLVLSIMLVCFLCTMTPVFGSDKFVRKQASEAYVPGELLVKYKMSACRMATVFYKTQWGIEVIKVFKNTRIQHVKLPDGMTVEAALEVYRNDPDVIYAEPNYIYHADVNDTHFNLLWGLHNDGQPVNGYRGTPDADIDALEAWNIITGSSDVVVAVIDTGVDYNHPDLASNIWANPGEIPGNGVDDDGNGYIDDVNGWDFVYDDNNPIDSHGHGTHCAGTIAAVGDNSLGVTGVSWSAKIMALRGLDANGSGTTTWLLEAVLYANTNGAHIISNSWGGGGFSTSMRDAIRASSAVVVCAAGNSGRNNDGNPHYPSSYDCPNIIAVAASDPNDRMASFSNYGTVSVDVAAPGVSIYSSKPSRRTIWSDNFDDGNIAGWTTGGTLNTWGVTTSESFSGSYSLADSPYGPYLNNTRSWARSPLFNFSSHTGVKLEFEINGASELCCDFIFLEGSSDGINWSGAGFSGSTGGRWFDESADLGYYDGESTVYTRARLVTDYSITYDGFYFDDVEITVASTSYNGSEYQFMNGTSMATPIVSGIAALVKARYPSLTNTGIKARIEDNVDSKPWLEVATMGRVNACKALGGTPPPPPPPPPPDDDSDGGCFIAIGL